MARAMRRRGARGRTSAARRPRKPTDWVNTQEGYDVDQTGTLVVLDNTLPEIVFPLMYTYNPMINAIGDFVSRSVPWMKRTCIRVQGWLHMFSPDYYAGTIEMSVASTIEKVKTDADSGACILPVEFLLDPEYADKAPIYWRNFQHLYHNTTWTSPEDFNTFKRSIWIDRRMRVPLDTDEVVGLHMQLTTWSGTVSTRLFVRPLLRCLVEMG